MSSTTGGGGASAPPTHVTESLSDRRKAKEMAEARASGAVAPEVDVKTGSMINPHNPEFITRRPWYLGGSGDGPSLDHQADQRAESDRHELSLGSADALVREERDRLRRERKAGRPRLGMWVEALRRGRKPYRICQVVRVGGGGTEFDLRYDDDGFVERRVKFDRKKWLKESAKGTAGDPRIRLTRSGARAHDVDHATHGKETYDSKRDAYHGYEGDHMGRMEEKWRRREELRKAARKEEEERLAGEEKKDKPEEGGTCKDKVENKGARGSDSDSDSDVDSDADDSSDDEFVQRDEDARIHTSRLARQGGVGGAQMKVTARNLRIREDTAKYLRNLDPSSAYYDPKSRSMRDNPNPELGAGDADFAGDNFSRISGDAVGLAETQTFAWDAERRSEGQVAIHPQADPSRAELLKKQFRGKREDLKSRRREAVLSKYGGEEYLDGGDGLAAGAGGGGEEKDGAAADDGGAAAQEAAEAAAEERRVRFGASVREETYTRDGRVAKPGQAGSAPPKRVALTSKYEEDIFQNGHVAVWGSYFHRGAFRWGYADDHSLIRNSYGTGPRGREANDEANEMRYGTGAAGSAQLAQARAMLPKGGSSGGRAGGSGIKPTGSKLYGEADQRAVYDGYKLEAALQKVDAERGAATANDDRKRKYNSLSAQGVDVTEEEMEAYRMRQERGDDPMAKAGGASEELLEYKK